MALSVFNQNYRISRFSLGLHYIMAVSGDTRSADEASAVQCGALGNVDVLHFGEFYSADNQLAGK